jgi:serine phosphatase RsbU (regulator of sigma subunit)
MASVPVEISEPLLLFVQGAEQRRVTVSQTPFTIGRKADRNLAIADTRVSREHASIVYENGTYHIVDQGGRSGVYVNGVRRERHRLQPNDRCDFGYEDFYIVFSPTVPVAATPSDLLSQVSMFPRTGGASELQQLRLFLEAARNLRSSGLLADVISTLLECSLRLTHAERGFVFLRGSGGELYLGAGRNSKGEPLRDESTISHSLLQQAADSGSEFVIGDTSKSADIASRASIMAHDLRSVVAIPLRRTHSVVEIKASASAGKSPGLSPIIGVLYLDSRFASREFSAVSQDILHAIAKEAAGLLENARLVEVAEGARLYEQELSIAARIQQRLMSVRIPDVPFAKVKGRNLPCHHVGGDFFDVVRTPDSISVVLTDVSGKGVSAALLGSVIQGMIHSQLAHGIPLDKAVTAAHNFLCEKEVGEKYATMVIARLWGNGHLELLNCGHVPPRLISGTEVILPDNTNPPVGLVPDVSFHSMRLQLKPGDRLILTTDGVVEAENADGEYFGEERLDHAVLAAGCEGVFNAVKEFCGPHPMQDDCTVVELVYVTAKEVAAFA